MNMRKVVWVGVAAIALFEAGFAHADVVRLGIAGPLTGPIAHLGKDAESGPNWRSMNSIGKSW